MGQQIEVQCTSVFQEDAEADLTARITEAWIALIHVLEQEQSHS